MLENEKFHWNGNVLHIVGEAFDEDTCWVRGNTMQEIRDTAPRNKDELLVFIIKRSEAGDEVFLCEELVVIPGGDALCYLAPMGETH